MVGVGICLGASNVSTVQLQRNDGRVIVKSKHSKPHDGNPRQLLEQLLLEEGYGCCDGIAVTGRKFKDIVSLTPLSEPEATELAYQHLRSQYGDAQIIVSAGGETFIAYEVDGQGKIINVYTGNKCASGTGEFFLQQIARMNLSIEEALGGAVLDQPYKVSGRCSVFCKSDCTHALNKGVDKGKVVAGLCRMMAIKISELLKKLEGKRVWLVGGSARNTVMVSYLAKEVEQLIIPEEAPYFEALGAALWSLDNPTLPIPKEAGLYDVGSSSFAFLPPLKEYEQWVEFKHSVRGQAREGDLCIVGLDVGSTTTKAVVLRQDDNGVLASAYLRTNGDPVGAARQCYAQLSQQLEEKVEIIALGVTGSGRQIAGLHGLTDGVINEIIAHAAAAVYFDPEVDTIFEIGGQDAKYTYITNMVPSDYAMNEACSAGTGSFLEESAKESLAVEMEDIGSLAILGTRPPNFNDQCAAFISSDIKNAVYEGLELPDIVAGLVYSICMNYNNRVKGSRTVGKKIFMQGGVCYNPAVPMAMAALTGKKITVPPEPGLMGAFGVALEVKNRLNLGLLAKGSFDLDQLARREVDYGTSFVCGGEGDGCDRKCTISLLNINGQSYPFGGACNKYVNVVQRRGDVVQGDDLVNLREKLLFEKYGEGQWVKGRKTIGLCKSLLTNSLYPLYANFFTSLGLNVVLVDEIDEEGMDKRGAAFCFPVEISHGMLASLLKRDDLDYIFLPHVKGMKVENGIPISLTCPLVQGEAYYLKSSFDLIEDQRVISPVIDFARGYEEMRGQFIAIGNSLGFSKEEGKKSYNRAVTVQNQYLTEARDLGQKAIQQLEQNPDQIGVVLFGRPYNAFAKEAHMGIPQKFASRGYLIIPCDFLPYGQEQPVDRMYWSMGQVILMAAQYTARHPQLFGTFITNFSCGPDSFVVSYFRDRMGRKPSLTLELDSHTADAGIDTRIEAFLDVVRSYLQLGDGNAPVLVESSFQPAALLYGRQLKVRDSQGNVYSLTDPRVHVLIPSMGDFAVQLLAASLRRIGVRATTVSPPREEELKLGRAYVTCKECLPLILTVGSLLRYLEEREDKDEILVYFMPEAPDPCRFGQYSVLMENLVQKMEIKDVAMLTLTSGNSYAGLGWSFLLRTWCSVLISDIMDDIYSTLLALAVDKERAMDIYYRCCETIVSSVERDSWSRLRRVLQDVAEQLGEIKLTVPYEQGCKIALVGEIYVRRDGFSRQYLVEKLAQKGIIAKTASVHEWVYYCDYLIKHNLSEKCKATDKVRVELETIVKAKYEREIKKIFAGSGLYPYHLMDVDHIIKRVEHLISPALSGEAILTIGAAITEILHEVSGVISIGPFGCMPNRVAEAVIGKTMNQEKRKEADHDQLINEILRRYPNLPFLAIEADGNLFPQIIEARLEAFCLQVQRVNETIVNIDYKSLGL